MNQETIIRMALEALEQNTYYNFDDDIKALREALAEQAEREPFVEHAQYDQHGICRMQKFSNGVTEFYGQDGSVIMRLDSSSPVVIDYAAPVRTKDLTDDEINKISGAIANAMPANMTVEDWKRSFARAIIASDREKNK